ncbi:plasmid replication protein RepC (plasmid) [Agrobacterium sp. 13-2099-1-2]|uniref:plasmid replication protein RepC n=1 Tax=Agrobacterium sp. 13-2099-1-2 TaxID=1841651 RepID=UPI00080FAE21|nr:plasmid replication protein RepC [Agrobacterium sp. 13-2099-1-2]UZX45514.1 plasmid replication protein RepC [Agrobacterium sp. 13-2099-1-2]
MQIGSVTTPFGRRPAKLALVKRQIDTKELPQGRSVDKWKVFRDACEARDLLGVQDRALAVLNALLTFYPETDLRHDGALVVFPSNAQLTVRSHGISGRTLRRNLAVLIDAGLIERRDSPNGKRYAHRDRAGDIEEAFGFSLAPLLARASEIAHMAQKVAEEGRLLKRAREALTICRRDVRKLISAAIEEGAEGDWRTIEAIYLSVVGRLTRNPERLLIESILDEMSLLREEIINLLEIQLNAQNMSANDGHNDRHIQNSNTETIYELEPSFEMKQGARAEQKPKPPSAPIKAFPLGMVLKACPQITDYGPGGAISSWRDLMSAAVVVRSMLGVSPSAYQDACEIMGPENAAATIACILEKAGQINSAGGYLRDLTSKAGRGEFSLGPAIMALLRANGGGTLRRA